MTTIDLETDRPDWWRTGRVQYAITDLIDQIRDEEPVQKKPKQALLNIQSPIEEFRFGNCALVAIAHMTGIKSVALIIIAELLKIRNPQEGLSFFSIKKLLNRLSESSHIRYYYQPNTTKVTYIQLVTLCSRSKILVMFDDHLSYAQYGIVYDRHWEGSQQTVSSYIPTGWWVEY